MKIETKDLAGQKNGFLVPIWNVTEDPGLRPEQVYLTVVSPHSRKGPHLHALRRGLFVCIKGNVTIVVRNGEDCYEVFRTGENHHYERILVPPGLPAAIYNHSDQDAFVLNMPSPAWTPEHPDEWPVIDWSYE